MIRIDPARDAEDYGQARTLFRAYAATLGNDICLAGFEQELAAIETIYGPPQGVLFLARLGDEPIGCAAVRRIDEARGELKRVYVSPACRGGGTGRHLVETAIEAARALGYRHLLLDTLDTMQAAQALYRSLGFREFTPGEFGAAPGLQYFSRDL